MKTPDHILERFPTLSDDEMRQRLEHPGKPVRVIIDTDAANEIDDQFAIAWALLSPDRLHLEGVTAVPFSFQHHRDAIIESVNHLREGRSASDDKVGSLRGWAERVIAAGRNAEDIKFVAPDEGAELSYEEILRVYDECRVSPEGRVFRGSPGYLTSLDEPITSPSADFIIERARAKPDELLYICAMGAVTNIASAFLTAPDIIRNVVVIWTSAYPSHSPHCNAPSLNLVQDPLASSLIFDCGVPHVYLPGYFVGAQLKMSLPEMERFVHGKSAIASYLHHLYTHNPLHEMFAITDPEERSWVLWDLIDIAWLFDPEWVPTMLVRSPVLDDDLYWQHPEGRHLMREAYDVNRDAIMIDLYRRLETAPD
ncbi:nucleoside hydrolase [Hoeflea sp. TYP-13]|uniref:nucleoside hydrolase n=1 Tax=Hoeflea sp. TYP-13 TaxID=3230023 RepID=UPI0034C630EA